MGRQPTFDREAVLDQAMRVFWRNGYEATGVDALLADLGLARASMYRTFGSKAELYAAALDRYREQEGGYFRDHLDGAGSVIEAVAAIFALVADQAANPDRPAGCFVVSAACERAGTDRRTARQVAGELQALENDLTSLLAAGVDSGELRADLDPNKWARAVVSSIQGLRVMATARPEPELVADTASTMIDALAEAMRS